MKQCAHFFYFFFVNQSKYLLKSVTDIWYARSWFCSRVIICCFFHNVKLDEYTVNHCQLSVFILILQNSCPKKSVRGLTCRGGPQFSVKVGRWRWSHFLRSWLQVWSLTVLSNAAGILLCLQLIVQVVTSVSSLTRCEIHWQHKFWDSRKNLIWTHT